MTMQPWMAPMLASSVDDVPTGDWILEPKLDGWRYIIHNTGRGVIAIAGRNGADYSGKLPYIESEVAKCLPPDTCVDGELIGSEWGDVQSVMAANGAHIPTQKNGGLKLVLFDVLRCNGQDTRALPWTERRAILDAATFKGYLSTTDVYPATRRAYQVAVELGFEGVVCKRSDSVYRNGRSSTWAKIKASATCEARIVGFKKGTGANKDGVGAIEIVLLDDTGIEAFAGGKPITTRASGMDAATRKNMVDQPELWMNAIVEIKHNGVLTSGKVRHPVFLRRRDDKMPATTPKRPVLAPRTPTPGTWVRNYGAMGAAKLAGVVRDLENAVHHGQSNDASQRVVQNGGDLAFNLARAIEAAQSKGITARP